MELEGLLGDLTSCEEIVWIVGPGPIVSENASPKPWVRFKNNIATVGCDQWHFHLPLASIASVEFIEKDDPNFLPPRVFIVRFSGKEGAGSPLRCYFMSIETSPPANVEAAQEQRRKAFEALLDRYVGQDGITHMKRVPEPVS